MTLRRGLLTSLVRDAKKCNRDTDRHLGYHEAQFPGTENSGREAESKFYLFGMGVAPKAVNHLLLGI